MSFVGFYNNHNDEPENSGIVNEKGEGRNSTGRKRSPGNVLIGSWKHLTQKVNVSTQPRVDWAFCGRQQNWSWVLSFDFVIEAVAIGQFRWNFSLQKYDLEVLNRGEHFFPQTVENRLWFCGDYFKEKKTTKPVRRQAKIGPGYLSSPPQNWLSLHNFTKTNKRSLKLSFVFWLLFRKEKAL